jgi:hypothetical protein
MRKLLITFSLLTFVVAGSVSAASPKAQQTTGIAYVSITHSEGQQNPSLFVAGDFNDKLFGRGAIVFVTTGDPRPEGTVIDVTAKRVTIYTTRGTLSGSGSGVQTINQDGTSDITGKFTLTKGTHTLKGHTFKGTFTGHGPGSGPYKLDYKGTLK